MYPLNTHSLKEVEKEFADMQEDLRDLEHELEFQRRSGAVDASDLFLPVMEEFAVDVRSVFSGIQTHMEETKTEVSGHMTYHVIVTCAWVDHVTDHMIVMWYLYSFIRHCCSLERTPVRAQLKNFSAFSQSSSIPSM